MCIRDRGYVIVDGQHAADKGEEGVRRAAAGDGIGARVHKADLVAEVIHVTLVVIDKNDVAVLHLERVVGLVEKALGLAAALDAGDNLYHWKPLLSFLTGIARELSLIIQHFPDSG